MKKWMVLALLAVVCVSVYWPHRNAQFILDDYYTVVRNPLIKNFFLYPNIWTSRLFDAHQASGYIKFGYYRPVLESSWVVDYHLFGLKTFGYQWINLLIHILNCFLIYILWGRLFGESNLALKASLLFAVLPSQEWVVRYVTGRADELSVSFALLALLFLYDVFRTGKKIGYVAVFIFWALAALTREVALSYLLLAFFIYRPGTINRFCLFWILIGLLPLVLIFSIIPKQGNILIWHVFYFASIGLCLWMAQLRWRVIVVLVLLFGAVSFYQGRFWTTEETLLRHTRSLEWWPRTVTSQQLLMKYDDDIPAINDLVLHADDPRIKAMWLRRLGLIYFIHHDLNTAQEYFSKALSVNASDVDALNSLAVVAHQENQEAESLNYLNRSFAINPYYPDTLRTLGIYYYIHQDFPQARLYLSHCLFFEPDNVQARQLLNLANKTN